jgi:hypothetical protein
MTIPTIPPRPPPSRPDSGARVDRTLRSMDARSRLLPTDTESLPVRVARYLPDRLDARLPRCQWRHAESLSGRPTRGRRREDGHHLARGPAELAAECQLSHPARRGDRRPRPEAPARERAGADVGIPLHRRDVPMAHHFLALGFPTAGASSSSRLPPDNEIETETRAPPSIRGGALFGLRVDDGALYRVNCKRTFWSAKVLAAASKRTRA